MRSIFVLLIIGMGLAGGIVSRHVALLAYVWFSLFRPVEYVWMDLSSLRLSLLTGLVLLVPSLLTGIFPNITHPLSILSWLFMGCVLIAQYTTYIPTDWSWVDQFARLLVVSGLCVSLATTKPRLSQLIAVIAGSFAFYSAKAGLVSMLGGGVQFAEGQAGAFVDNNGYALAVNMAIPFMATAAVTLTVPFPGIKYIRQAFWICIPLSVVTVIGTMSRAGLLGLGTLALVFALLQRRPVLWTTGMVVGGALVFTLAPKPDGYMERMGTITKYEEVGEGSALGRLHFWRIAFIMTADNPLGVGLRNYDHAYDDYDDSGGAFGRGRSVHNSHLQVMTEEGYAGFLIWLTMFGYALIACVRIRFGAAKLQGLSAEDRQFYQVTATSLAASMLAFMVGGAFIASANNDFTWMTFGVVAATHRMYRAEVLALKPARVDTDRAAAVIPRARRKAIA